MAAVDMLGCDLFENWHAPANDLVANSFARGLNGHVPVNSVDQARAAKLAIVSPFCWGMQAGQARHQVLQVLVDAPSGLASDFGVHETVDGIASNLGESRAGSLGCMQFVPKGGAEGHSVNVKGDAAADEATLESKSSIVAELVSHHSTARSVIRGCQPRS